MKQIESLEELIKISSKKKEDFFVRLNGGLRSSKDIYYSKENKIFSIYNHIDGLNEIVHLKDFKESFIGKALKAGALYKY